jgi:hypothetical protein
MRTFELLGTRCFMLLFVVAGAVICCCYISITSCTSMMLYVALTTHGRHLYAT